MIPKKSLLARYKQIPTQVAINKENWNNYFENSNISTEPGFEDALTINWWLSMNITIGELLPILTTLGEIQNWTENTQGLRSFGNEDSNDISVSFDNTTNYIQEIICRLDLRKPDKKFIDKVLSLGIQYECLLMDRKGNLYEPEMNALIDSIKVSNGYRYVSNAEKFFNDLSNGISTLE